MATQGAGPRRSRLLIVDDDDAHRQTLAAILEAEGFDLTACATAQEAMGHLLRGGFGVAIVDLRLPDLSGTQLLQKLQDLAGHVDVIVHTAYSSYESARDAVNLGAFGYVEKGGDPGELVRHVHRAFQARLRRYAEELESAVAERTRELQEVNAALRQEIAERKRAEEELRESEAKYRTLVEQLPAVTYIAALDGASTTLYVSPQIEAMIGFSPAEYAADPDVWRQRLHPDDRERVIAEVARSQATGEPLASEYRMITRDGRVVWLRDEAAIVRDDAGEPLFLQGVMLDITERKSLEREVLEISDAERRRIGHELHDGVRQELTGIRFMAGALAQKLAARAAPEAEDAEAITRLLDEAAEHTRALARGMCPLALVHADFLPALEELASTARDRFRIACDLRCDALPDRIDDTMATHLYHIAQEAVANAVEHAKAKHIETTLATEGGATTLTVRDDGLGLPEDPNGLKGLGLRIMRYRADVMGASLDVRRQAEGGTIVMCSIPASAREGEGGEHRTETRRGDG